MPNRRAKDMTGRTFGKWTVLGRAVKPRPGYTMWTCRCDPARGGCGVVRDVGGGTLTSGRSKSCLTCAAVQRHKDNPDAYRGANPKRWKLTCETCRKRFRGYADQRFCSSACWPCRQRERVNELQRKRRAARK